jgi:predicted secreted hydrolase
MIYSRSKIKRTYTPESRWLKLDWNLVMPGSLVLSIILCFAAASAFAQVAAPPVSYKPAGAIKAFPVSPHNDVTIEWWYLNANLQTKSGRHLALIASFFRFGNAGGAVAEDSTIKVKQSHYLIYGITDLDSKKHCAYSYGDRNTLNLLREVATMGLMTNPNSQKLQALVIALDQGSFPPPTQLIKSPCSVSAAPFYADYGLANSVKAVKGAKNAFTLNLGGPNGGTTVKLRFTGLKTPMMVNGDGNTGLRVRTDMKYISLTRCSVSGSINMGGGPEPATGEGWFDHQWGNSWTSQSAGWDWWGVQLANGTDVLFFQQIDLKTGKTFFPCATFEDANGRQVTTHDIKFSYASNSEWQSPRTGVAYPLDWTILFPEQNTALHITPRMSDQEMPVLASGGSIWEGACSVSALVKGASVPGIAYQELVGYNSPAIRAGLEPTTSLK